MALPGQLCDLKFASDGVSFPFPLNTWDLPSSFTLAVSSPARASWLGWNLGLHFCREKPVDSRLLHWPGPMALHLFGLFWTPRGFGGWLGCCSGLMGSRFLGLAQGRAPRSGLGLVFGARVQDAAVCAIINLHLLTGSGGAAVSACGPRMRDWLREGESSWGPLGHAGPGPMSLVVPITPCEGQL